MQSVCHSPFRTWSATQWLARLAALLVGLMLFAQAPPTAASPSDTVADDMGRPHSLRVTPSSGPLALWPAASLLVDPGRMLAVEQVLAQPQKFERPGGTEANLGRTNDAVWLRVPLWVEGAQPLTRTLEIDYPPLNRVDVHLVQGNRVLARHRLGNQLRFDERPLPSRSHAVMLTLPPGHSEVVLRVETTSSLVLPMTLRAVQDFTLQESRAQLLQGLLLGLGLCMLGYSVSHWVGLRDRVFGLYAAMLAANLVFMLSYFGVGPQYLWPDWPELSQRVAPLAVLVSVAAAAAFITDALEVHRFNRVLAWLLRGMSVTALALLAAAVTGLLSYRGAQGGAQVLGLGVLVMVLPTAWMKALKGDRGAAYMLVGWSFYLLGAATITALLCGWIAPSPLVQFVFPLATITEMAAWMLVLALRVQTIHRHAGRAKVESETLRALAHTDALTGLPNRRGLYQQLELAMPIATPQRLLAVYLLDLDGFKPVNDRHGHDVGDALLLAVGQRLSANLRGSDVVARLGGDEFVVLAAGLPDEATARQLGQQMLASFKEPFSALGQRCDVGLTIGYALAPLDGQTTEELIKRADAAMYTGKQAGRGCVQRGGRSLVAV